MKRTATRILTSTLLCACWLLASPLLANRSVPDGDDGSISYDYDGTGSHHVWRLRTLDDRDQVRVHLTAHTGKSSIRVRITDPDGRDIADMQGNGELAVDTDPIRLVEKPAGKGEARRGTWEVEVTTSHGAGSFELRWWGLASPAH